MDAVRFVGINGEGEEAARRCSPPYSLGPSSLVMLWAGFVRVRVGGWFPWVSVVCSLLLTVDVADREAVGDDEVREVFVMPARARSLDMGLVSWQVSSHCLLF